jgi:hypothetical protein
MALSRTADRGIAGHIGNRIERHRKKHRVDTRSRASEGGFYTRVSRAYYGNLCFLYHIFSFGKSSQTLSNLKFAKSAEKIFQIRLNIIKSYAIIYLSAVPYLLYQIGRDFASILLS